MEYSNLILNAQSYSKSELLELSQKKLNNSLTEEWQLRVFSFIQEWLDDNDFMLVQTSGSTGNPKQLRVEKKAMIQSAFTTGNFFELKRGNTALMCLPANFIAGKMMIVRAFVLGLNLIIAPPKSNILACLGHMPIDFASVVPMQIQKIMSSDKNNRNNSLFNIGTLLVGGASINRQQKSFLATLKCRVFATYGMTETLTHIAVQRIERGKLNSYYNPLPGVEITKDKRGCLVINARHLNINSLATNDLVEINKDGQFTLVGRVDNIINTGAVKVSPEIIEEKLSMLIKERRYMIYPEKDSLFSQKVALLLEGEDMSEDEKKSLITNLNTKLKKFEKLRTISFLPKFAETNSGKIHRKKTLQQLFKNQQK